MRHTKLVMKYGCWLLLMCVIFWGAAGSAACDRVFRIGVNESEPLYYKNEKYVYTGFVYDLVQEMTARTGCRFVPEQVNRSRVYLDLRTSRIDMAVVTIKNKLFDEIASFMPLYRFRREALVPVSRGRYSDFSQLLMDSDLRFAILPRAAFMFLAEEERRLTKEKRLITTPSLQEAEVRMLQKSLDEIRRDGTLKRLLAKYSSRPPEIEAALTPP